MLVGECAGTRRDVNKFQMEGKMTPPLRVTETSFAEMPPLSDLNGLQGE
jgi:hypothetical protein